MSRRSAEHHQTRASASRLAACLDRFRVPPGRAVALKDHDPGDTCGYADKAAAEARLVANVSRLSEQQDRLYAQDQFALLVIFQALDAAGKDSTIKHVMSGINPQGCQVVSFKAPSAEELDHDFLWRAAKALPERGRIGIFNRSYYEEVLVVRVHPELLERQHLPSEARGPKLWQRRFEQINAFEQYLTANGIVVVKFFLHVSREEQRKRFLARIAEPEKNWKFSVADAEERTYWPDYLHAYQEVLRHTSTPWAPWFVLPADHKWVTRLAASEILVATLEGLQLEYPQVSEERRAELQRIRTTLETEA